jgi:hypothetical protein
VTLRGIQVPPGNTYLEMAQGKDFRPDHLKASQAWETDREK